MNTNTEVDIEIDEDVAGLEAAEAILRLGSDDEDTDDDEEGD